MCMRVSGLALLSAGLLLKRWRQELLFLVILVGFYGLLTMVLG